MVCQVSCKYWTQRLPISQRISKKDGGYTANKIVQLQKIAGGLNELTDQLAKEAENEKVKAIATENLLKSLVQWRAATTTSNACKRKEDAIRKVPV